MIIKWIGVLLIAAAGVLPAIRVNLRERRRLARIEAFSELCRFAAEQTASVGIAVSDILSRAGSLCEACGAEDCEPDSLVRAAEEYLPKEGVRAIVSVFASAAGTREEQICRCRAANAVMEDVRNRQSEELRGNLRTGIVLPLSAAAVALLLLW